MFLFNIRGNGAIEKNLDLFLNQAAKSSAYERFTIIPLQRLHLSRAFIAPVRRLKHLTIQQR